MSEENFTQFLANRLGLGRQKSQVEGRLTASDQNINKRATTSYWLIVLKEK
jgi:hypothetical protein